MLFTVHSAHCTLLAAHSHTATAHPPTPALQHDSGDWLLVARKGPAVGQSPQQQQQQYDLYGGFDQVREDSSSCMEEEWLVVEGEDLLVE